ncbi:hypothetical protein RHSIM_Rhsim11G0104400 [Rhododendron simsii]|uniref:F-box domain-containing protein n=1 Tax=Rhododendron simsii TaxID=118357 RepID=A0A834G7H3_RHOSS|nr:hypothetical protein RHSIM_Rhsim11G0104400 [Rhododendron simsii]
MSLECLTWIPHLWDTLICSLNVRKDGFSMQDLPEEILIDILSRLPGNCVLECRRVCNQWLALTSTPSFVEMHLKRAAPVLFVQCIDHVEKMDMFIFDEGAKANQMIKKIGAEFMHLEASHVPILSGSCDGLLLFRPNFPSSLSIVCNPLTGEKVTIRAPVDPVIVCGVFFHPLTKDYKLLFVHQKQLFAPLGGVAFEYFLYNLGGQCWRKLDGFPYQPIVLFPPTILNGALHWIVNPYWVRVNNGDIPPSDNLVMMFNMDTEEFRHMPHPGVECPMWEVHKNARLFEMKGKLASCHVNNSYVYVWALEDYKNWIWVKRYSVNLHLDVKRYPFDITHISPSYWNSLITLVGIQNDELLFDWNSRGVFRYNLLQKTIKQINGVGMKQTPLLPFGASMRCIMSYTKTFVTPIGFQLPDSEV